MQFVFVNARKQGMWRDIRSVEVKITFKDYPPGGPRRFFRQTVGHQQDNERWWKEFKVTMRGYFVITAKASM